MMRNENFMKLVVVLVAFVLTIIVIVQPLIVVVQNAISQVGMGLQ